MLYLSVSLMGIIGQKVSRYSLQAQHVAVCINQIYRFLDQEL